MIVQRFNLNLIPNQSPVIVHVNQYDTGTGRLIATLYEGNEPYSPNGTAVIQGTKPDGHGFQYTATLDGNVVTADLTEQMAPVAGDVRVQIVVTESSGVTGTFAFIMRVQPSALPSDTDMSESDYQYIEEAIREAQEAVHTAQEATETAQEAVERAQEAITETQENAENSEAWAQGTRGGIPVEPTDPTYEHNAEYWAQYAERYAQGGLHYKASIPFADIPTTGMREGDMYDITDDFTTDSRFTEGAGIKVKGGTNIAWNSDNKWDILALPYIPKTTFNGRSGSILPMAGDYDSKKILLTSALHIGGETQENAQEALEALSNDGVKSFNGRSGSVLPMAGDYSAEQVDYDSNQTVKEKIDALVTKEASDIAGQQSLVKDTVGWTGKNRAYSQTNNAVIAHIENGITYDVSWTGSATVTLKKNSASGATITSGSTSPLSFTADADYELYFGSSATVTNIMVKDSRITDPTYEPYHESVEEEIEQIYADNGVLGAKNLMINEGKNETINGVAFTVNEDGSITANGTASTDAYYSIASRVSNKPLKGLKHGVEYILSGDNSPATDSYIFVNYFVGSTLSGGANTNNGEKNFTIPNDKTYISYGIGVKSGKTVTNKTFYPMLRLASDPDDTYQPYAMTNRELTEKKINIADLKTVVSASSDFTDFKTRIASL